MPRYRLTIEYDGSAFHGWQSQASGKGVQDYIADAIEQFCGESPIIYGAGRTDSGVHAAGQVAHIDLAVPQAEWQLRDGVNHHLRPHRIAILHAVLCADDFDARFSALSRLYQYRLMVRRAPLTFDMGRAWHVRADGLDIEAMRKASAIFIGKHDFTTFRSRYCQARSPIKTLDRLAIEQSGQEIIITARARSFLHKMVRSMVGALKHVGAGKWNCDDVAHALAACDRSLCPPLAPPHGLYLMAVDYSHSK